MMLPDCCCWRMMLVVGIALVVVILPQTCHGFGISPPNMRTGSVHPSSKLCSTQPDNKNTSRRRTTTTSSSSSSGSSSSRTPNNRFKGRSGSSSSSRQSSSSSKSRSQTWYKNRSSKGIKSKNRKRTPRWETEGDALYQLIDLSSSGVKATFPTNFRTSEEEYQYIEQLLSTNLTKQTQSDDDDAASQLHQPQTPRTSTTVTKEPKEETSSPSSFSNTMMWGTCSVGPLLRSKLVDTWGPTPTPIQQMSFPLISSSSQNIILASPTGTGKTLAYLLPLLSTMSRTTTKKKNKDAPHPNTNTIACKVLIVTPTIDLAKQIQQQVNLLWPPQDESSAMYVVEQQQQQQQQQQLSTNDKDEHDTHMVTSSSFDTTKLQHATIVAGTPRALSQMMIELKKQSKRSISDAQGRPTRSLYTQLRMNLRTIVLDEADRLLRTESVARAAATTTPTSPKWRKTSKTSTTTTSKSPTEMILSQFPRLNYHYRYTTANTNTYPKSHSGRPPTHTSPEKKKKKKKKKTNNKTTTTTTSSDSSIQLICASATVGRTLRRQLMDMIDAPSIEKAATLVTADPKRTKKGTALTRKSTLLPSTIHHWYVLPPPPSSLSSLSKLEQDPTHTDDDHPHASQVTISPTTTTTTAAADALVHTLYQQQLQPAPLLVFPGSMGVAGMVETLQTTYGFQNVQTLSTRSSSSPQSPPWNQESVTNTTTTATTNSNHPTSYSYASSWVQTPVYVIGEKFGRGLDLQVDYVWLSSTPSSPAAYTHLAGRTGRHDQQGYAMTFVSSVQDAHKVMQLSERLGIRFTNGSSSSSSSRNSPPPPNTSRSMEQTEEIREKTEVVGGVVVPPPLELNHPVPDTTVNREEDSSSTTTTTTTTTATMTTLSPPIPKEDNKDHCINDNDNDNPWSTLSKSALRRKTVAELRHYLKERNIDTTNSLTGKPLLKADLIVKVEELLLESSKRN